MQHEMSLIFSCSFSYGVFFCLLLWGRRQKAHRLIGENGCLSCSPLLLLLHGGGVLLFGLNSLLLHQPGVLPVLNSGSFPVAATAINMLLLVGMLFLSPRLAVLAYTGREPGVQLILPTSFFLTSYFLMRFLFIAAYEWWFRGVLLAGTIAWLGVPLAVYLNVVLYTLLHTVNGKKEMLGCIPFGLLLCTLCIWQQAVWPAIALHLALTLPYEITLLKKIKKNLPHENSHYRRVRLYRA